MDAVLNQGMPAPIDVQVSGMDLKTDDDVAQDLARQFRACRAYPTSTSRRTWTIPRLQVNVNRERASQLGLSPKEVIDNLITALTSDAMIAPELLGRSEERQQLFRHRAVSGKSGEIHRGSENDAACAPQI